MTKKRIVVGMSGGVDSSVTALLLKQQGFDVVGLFMKNWEDDDTDEYCSSKQDLIDAASVADIIGIPLEAVNFSAEYKDRVFANFLAEYQAGRTPNPDVLCNAEIKFKAFLDHAIALGAEKIATGHYAQVREVDGLHQLLKGEDGSKDQSYFLYRLNQAQLSRSLFPIGHLYKREVRKIAEQNGLPNFSKKDSTGICFIGERPFREFLNRYLPRQPGEMQTPEGKVVGQHIGLMYYTIGQRQGLGIGGMSPTPRSGADLTLAPRGRGRGAGERDDKHQRTALHGQHLPWFVAAKDMARNVLVVVQGHEHPLLYRSSLQATDLTWVSGANPHCNWVYAAKTRYRQSDAPCSIARIAGDLCEVEFATPQWAVTPGQSVVVYESKVCLGGGIIA